MLIYDLTPTGWKWVEIAWDESEATGAGLIQADETIKAVLVP